MATSAYIFIPETDNDGTGTLVRVHWDGDEVGNQLADLVKRDGYAHVAATLAQSEWSSIDPNQGESKHRPVITGYGEVYDDPDYCTPGVAWSENLPAQTMENDGSYFYYFGATETFVTAKYDEDYIFSYDNTETPALES